MTLKRKCAVSFTVLSLLMMLLTSYAFSVQATGQPDETKIPPGMPENAVQFNRTDITPTGYIDSVQAMKTNVFFYRNFTLLMNCTKDCEMNMTLDPQVRERILSVSVDPNQTMKLTMNVSASTPQGEAAMNMNQTLNFYMKLETNGTEQFQAQLRFLVNQTELSAELDREVNASRLTWMYWNQTQEQWKEVESYMDQNGYLVCNTDHFSTWTVAEVVSPEDIPEGIHLLTVVALAVIVTAVAALMKRKKIQT